MLRLCMTACFAGCVVGWSEVGQSGGDEVVKFTVGLRQQNLDWLAQEWEEVVVQVGGPRWRDFHTIEEVNSKVASTPADVAAATQWAHDNKFTIVKAYPDAMTLAAPVGALRTAFPSLTFYTYSQGGTSVVTTKTTPHSVALPSAVSSIHGLHKPSVIANRTLNLGKADSISPQTIRDQYGITPSNDTIIGNVSVAQMSFCPVSVEDCNQFCKEGDLPCSLSSSHVKGPSSNLEPCSEADMDVQMVFSSGPGVTLYVDGGYSNFLEWTTAWFNDANGVMVSSLSYGMDETTEAQQAATNSNFQKLGLTGRAIFIAAGDAGADGSSSDTCGSKFKPEWPATSPYITAVGATQSKPGSAPHLSDPSKLCNPLEVGPCVGKGVEEAVSTNVSMFTSGGGFSNVYGVASWQADVVKGYLSSGVKLPPSNMWNDKGRGYPDVAAFGGQNLIVNKKVVMQAGGTSASTPIWGGVWGLMNSVAFRKSGKPLGPAAPYLYHLHGNAPQCFTDITLGDNVCPSAIIEDCDKKCHGFYTTKGWDPVSGLGSPNVPCLLNYIENNL